MALCTFQWKGLERIRYLPLPSAGQQPEGMRKVTRNLYYCPRRTRTALTLTACEGSLLRGIRGENTKFVSQIQLPPHLP